MDNELIERARELAGNDYSDQGNGELRELVPALCDALEAAQAENARIKMDVKSLEIANRESMNMLIERDDEIKRLKSETYCAYCGERFELDNGSASLVSEHIRTCVKHPMRAVEAENARLRAERDAADYLLAEGEAHAPADFDGEVERLKAENARLREAMAWYADENNYKRGGVPGNLQLGGTWATREIMVWKRDNGERARAALEVKHG